MTVTIVPVMPISIFRASSTVPWNASSECELTLTSDSADPAARAAATDSVGRTHSDPRTYSDSPSRRIFASLHDASESPTPGSGMAGAGACPWTRWPGHLLVASARFASTASRDSIVFRPFSGAAAFSRPLIPFAERALWPAA